jgi:hypothetical protein
MSLYNDYEIDEYEKITEEIKSIILDKPITKVDINNLNINDLVYVCFYPNSQKHIYILTPKVGRVSSIKNCNVLNYDDKEDEYIQIKIINYKNETEDLLHPGVSYMGHSLGYDYQIYLIE